jgi:hypothetical protein
MAVLAAPPPQAAQLPSQTETTSTKFSEGVVDAYSVFASFNTNTSAGNGGSKASTDTGASDNGKNAPAAGGAAGNTQNGTASGGISVGIGLGELFATGDAAVQLAEGVNYYMSRAGNAEIAKALPASNCAPQTGATKPAKTETPKEPGCAGGTPTADTVSKTVPSLASITPTSGSAPPAGGTAGTKIVVTLAGTGFGPASALAITGVGVTYDQLMTSSDGKTMAATLTIAPGAPKAACTIAVTNPSGGATSAGLPFMVN